MTTPRRPSLLSTAPHDEIGSLRELVGIANAIEAEAVARYAELATLMERRSEGDTAAVLRDMAALEEGHVDMVGRWAAGLGQEVPPAREFVWRLPPELGASWEEARNSSLLTPYRALAIAVVNEERAFALYSYLAAQATDPEVARQAEAMAREELAHAAELRVRRRQAYHREHPGQATPVVRDIEDLAAFRALEGRLEREAAVSHDSIARALDAAGDPDSAALVARLARQERESAGGDGVQAGPAAPAGRGAATLLRAAIQPLERASETYEDLIAHADREDLLLAEQSALHRTVERISLLGRRLEEVETAR